MKGQTALEYLITYGWAILVILVVLAVLWYYGIFNPARWAGEAVTEGSAFKVVDKNLQVGTLTLVLGNKAGTTVTIQSIEVTGDITSNPAVYVDLNMPEIVVAGANIASAYAIPVDGLSTASVGAFAKFQVKVTYDTAEIAGKTDVADFSIKVSG